MIEELEIVKIEKIRATAKKTRTMYDLETKKNHNFFANGILVHNSATARRDDGNDMMIWATTGYIIHSIGSKELIEKGWLTVPEITFIKNYVSAKEINILSLSLDNMEVNMTKNYSDHYNVFVTNNTKRNDVIKNLVDKHKNKKILILVKLVNHGELLKELIPGSEYLCGSSKKEERKKFLEELKDGDLKVLIATISIASEGIDIPKLDIVINASANAGSIKTVQMLGRALRKKQGKVVAKYFDFLDPTDFFKAASFKRRKAFINEQHNVRIIDWKENQ